MTNNTEQSKKRTLRPFPQFSLEETSIIANAIQEKNAGKPMRRLLLADSVGRKPTSSDFRDLLSSSYKYGLTSGTEKADYISLTELGVQVTRPKTPEALVQSKQSAVLSVEIFKKIFLHYKDAKFPSDGQFFENTLEQEFGVPREYLKEMIAILKKNGEFAGLIRIISGSRMVMFDDFTLMDKEAQGEKQEEAGAIDKSVEYLEEEKLSPEEAKGKSIIPKPIFIAHGKDKRPLDQLIKILDQFGIKYKVSVNEAHSGRPISQKVKDLMNECGSAVFIFSKDGEDMNEKGETVPNLNVVFELGAASVLYGEKVIIFKEDGMKFSSDFDNLGHISFEADKLGAQAMNLMKELISMGFLKVVAA